MSKNWNTDAMSMMDSSRSSSSRTDVCVIEESVLQAPVSSSFTKKASGGHGWRNTCWRKPPPIETICLDRRRRCFEMSDINKNTCAI